MPTDPNTALTAEAAIAELVRAYSSIAGGSLSAAPTPSGLLLPIAVDLGTEGMRFGVDEGGQRLRAPISGPDGKALFELHFHSEAGAIVVTVPLTPPQDAASADSWIAELERRAPVDPGWRSVARWASLPNGSVGIEMFLPMPGLTPLDGYSAAMAQGAVGYAVAIVSEALAAA